MTQQQPASGGCMAGMEACRSFDSRDSARLSVSSAPSGPCSIGPSLLLDDVDGGVDPEFDVLSFALDSFISYLVDETSHFHDFATFINERPNFYDRFDIKAIEVFELSMLPMSGSGVLVTKQYDLSQLYSMDAYLHMAPDAK
jgi:hypothetical protein